MEGTIMKNYSKKLLILPLLCAVLMLTAAVLVPAGETHAAAYQGWGVQLPNGGDELDYPSPSTGRTKIWGYTSGGGSGNTVVNGTLNLSKNVSYYATAFVDTNLSANVYFKVTAEIFNTDSSSALASSSGQTLHTAGTGADATAVYSSLGATFARGYHKVTTSYYGSFIGRTAGRF